jgi:dihydropteroate synthase
VITHSGALPEVLCGRTVKLDLRAPCIVGILNVTPDSFSDGGRYSSLDAALAHAIEMAKEGAALIDIGGESTRPGAPAVSEAEEMDRVLPVIEALRREVAVPLSIDTTKSSVAKAAVLSGVEFINDISGLTFDPDMAAVAAETGAGLILMHTRGRPDVMQSDTCYVDIVSDVVASLNESVNKALEAGVLSEKVAVDPGIGFGKDDPGNLELLRRLPDLSALGYPLMLGTSRKSFIGRVLGVDSPDERLAGTLATIALGYAGGARLFRVHDVAAAWQAAGLTDAICKGAEWVNN